MDELRPAVAAGSVLCKSAPAKSDVHMEESHRRHHGYPGRAGPAQPAAPELPTVHTPTLGQALAQYDIRQTRAPRCNNFYSRARRRADPDRLQPESALGGRSTRPRDGRDPRRRARLLQGRRPGGAERQPGRDGCIVKTAGVVRPNLVFAGPAKVYESQDEAGQRHPDRQVVAGGRVVIRYEGPRAAPACRKSLSHQLLKSKGLGKACALITDGRFSGGTSGLSIRPRLAGGGRGRRDRPVEDGTGSRSTFPAAAWAGAGRRHPRRPRAAMEAKGKAPGRRRRAAARSRPQLRAVRRLRHQRRAGPCATSTRRARADHLTAAG